MHVCQKCGKELPGDCADDGLIPVAGCTPPQGAIWVHVTDNTGHDVQFVPCKGPSDGATGESGIAKFDPLNPGAYDVDLGKLGDLEPIYDLPAPPTLKPQVPVSPGQITYVSYILDRKAALKVKVVMKGDESKVFEGATVTISGPQQGEKPTVGTGIADFGLVSKGKYTIKAKLKDADDKDYATTLDFAQTAQEVELFPGKETEVKVEVEKKTVVTPKLEMEYKLILLDTKLYREQAGETLIQPSPTYVQLSFDPGDKAHTFKKGATLECSPGNVEVFLDEFCQTKLEGAITPKQLTDSNPLKLYLRGTTAGKFKIKFKLDDPGDRLIRLEKNPTDEQEMGVVKVEMKLHQQDYRQLVGPGMQLDPDSNTYLNDLKNKALPDQKLMDDEEKIGKGSKDDGASPGRLLHVQDGNNYGRAKLICAKLEAGDLPAGTDTYDIVLNVGRGWAPTSGAGAMKPQDLMGGPNDTPASGTIELYDQEFDGTRKDPVKIKVADLKAGEKTFYVQGTAETDQACGVRLDIGMDRDAGGLAKTVKRNGDWVRFTIVKIKEVNVVYTPTGGGPDAWDSTNNRFFINFQRGVAGRKAPIQAELTKHLKNVLVYFALAPDKDNRTATNWGVAMPATWDWKKITNDVKHAENKSQRKDFLHLSAKTDGDGKAKMDLTLSQFGGDKFWAGCYLESDAHLAKYVHGHPDLGVKKPVLTASAIIVWRKFWFKLITVEGVANPGVAGAVARYLRVKATMESADPAPPPPPAPAPAPTFTKVQATGWKGLYKRYMIALNGGNADALVISDQNKANFFPAPAADAAHPVEIPVVICDAQWDVSTDNASATDTGYFAYAQTHNVTTDRLVLKPPLQGGDLLVGGTVKCRYRGMLGIWVNGPEVNLTDANVDVDSARADLNDVCVTMPQAIQDTFAAHPTTQVKLTGLEVLGANGPYLGEYSQQHVLVVYEPSNPNDFQNSVTHEIGHGLKQTIAKAGVPTGIPEHPKQYISHDSDGTATGSHCKNLVNKCVMYESGPIANSLDRYCDVCVPYLLVDDMSRFK